MMDFNKFCETIAEKLGVRLVPMPTRCEYSNRWVSNEPYDEFSRRRCTYDHQKYDVYFVDYSLDRSIDYMCTIFDSETHLLWGYASMTQRWDEKGIPKNPKPFSSFFNREDRKQEVYYDGDNLKRAVNALIKRKPYLVW